MGNYASPADEEFFGAIGRLTISWSLLEAGLDFSVVVVQQGLGGDAIERKRPRVLSRKLAFLTLSAKRLDALAPFRGRIIDVCEEALAAAETRHDIIHGFVVEHAERSGEAKLIRLIHKEPIPKPKIIEVTTKSILIAANEANKLAGKALTLCTDLQEFLSIRAGQNE